MCLSLLVRTAAVLFLTAGQAASDPDSTSVARRLAADPSLGDMHRGYLRYVASRPALAPVERDWWRFLAEPEHHGIAARLDAAVQRDARAVAALDAPCDALARNPDAEDNFGAAMEELAQLQPLLRRQLLERLADFAAAAGTRDDPARAASALRRSVSLGYLPEGALRALAERLLSAAAQHPVLRAIADADPALSEDIARIVSAEPHVVALWHRRNRALAEDAHARAWIRHWQRVVADTPGLGAAYWGYLQTIDTDSLAPAGTPWPPKYAPPAFVADSPPAPPPATAPQERPSRPSPPEASIQRPAPPVVPRPAAPRMPSGPSRPTPPAPPERPAAPRPE